MWKECFEMAARGLEWGGGGFIDNSHADSSVTVYNPAKVFLLYYFCSTQKGQIQTPLLASELILAFWACAEDMPETVDIPKQWRPMFHLVG